MPMGKNTAKSGRNPERADDTAQSSEALTEEDVQISNAVITWGEEGDQIKNTCVCLSWNIGIISSQKH